MVKKVFFSLLFLITSVVVGFSTTSHAYAFSSDFTKGANLRPASVDDFSSDTFKQSLLKLSQDGANLVTLVIPWYQTNTTTTALLHGNDTPSDASVINAITYAHSLGLKVMLKPHVDPFSGEWRAMINPSDRATWFNNYGNMLTHYAQIAEQNHVEAMCLGTELYDMTSPNANPTNTTYWNNMIQQVRDAFGGKLTYDAQHSGPYSELNEVTFWDKLDFIGISGYFPLSGSSVSDYLTSWKNADAQYITPLYQKWNKPIWFTEVGYKSISGANTNPGDWQKTGGLDLQGQAALYQALFTYWTDKPYLKGITFWEWTSNPNGGGSSNTDYTPQNKPAEAIIKQWYTQNSGGSLAANVSPAASPYPMTVSFTPQTPGVGQQVTATVSLTASSSISDGIVDVEVYDGAAKIAQKFYDHQTILQGNIVSFSIPFTPQSTGTYIVKVGIFNTNWSGVIFWNDNAGSLTVGSVSPAPSTTPIPTVAPISAVVSMTAAVATNPSTITIWWPADKASMTGTQPFKAVVDGLPLNQYTMYWQVDGGQLNLMADSQTDSPHKQSDVDVSGWNWKGIGPYVITFTAKDPQGKIISSKSVNIFVSK